MRTETMNPEPLFIIAGNYQQYKDYVRWNDLVDNVTARYMGSPISVVGRRNGRYRIIGTARKREDFWEMYQELRAAGFTEDDK